jgi:hypothetical protein
VDIPWNLYEVSSRPFSLCALCVLYKTSLIVPSVSVVPLGLVSQRVWWQMWSEYVCETRPVVGCAEL